MTRRPFLLTCILSSWCLSCGPEQKKDDGGVTPETACVALCDYELRCPDPALTSPSRDECITSCRANSGTAPVYRKDVVDVLVGCYPTLACDVDNDTCINQAAFSSGANDPGVRACLARHEDCDATGTSFWDDLCPVRLLLITSAQGAFDLCMSKACGEIEACINAVAGRTQVGVPELPPPRQRVLR
jgi:hypothetical protein